MNNQREPFIASLHQKLAQALPGAVIEIIDESADHVGHRASGAHLALTITYAGFADKSKLEQHQLIYSILQEEMKEQIHALKLITKVK